MIDHALARRQLATTIDFALDVDAALELDHHVVGCPDCTAFETTLRRDAAVLRDLDLGTVSIDVRDDLAAEAGRKVGGGTLRWVTLAAATVLLLTALGAGAVGVGALRSTVPGATMPPGGLVAATGPIAWDNGLVRVQADEAWFEADGVRSALPEGPDGVLGGDDEKGATIITRWVQGGADRTLILTFMGDDATWSLQGAELWRSDAGRFRQLVGSGVGVGGAAGSGPADEVVIPLRTLNGDVEGGRLVFRGLRADAYAITPPAPVPPNGVEPFPVKGPIPGKQPVDPLEAQGLIACSGLLQSATPLDAESLAAELGFAIAWRVRWTGEGGAIFERDEAQPQEGTIIEASMLGAVDSAPNALLLVVAAPGDPLAVPIPAAVDCPVPGAPVIEAQPAP